MDLLRFSSPAIGRRRPLHHPPQSKRSPPSVVAAAKESNGSMDDPKAVASMNLDFVPARRRVRDAFADAQRNIDHILFKKAPPGITMKESYEVNSKGLEVFWKSWSPKSGVPAKGSLFFCHGYGDTCTFFFEGIAKRIADAGYYVFAMDYPGFGLSDGLHGYIPSFDEMIDQLIEQYAMKEVSDLPHFLLGQSMGGAVALKTHLKQPMEWDGVILVAPMCKIAKDVTPPDFILKALGLMAYFLPEAKLFPVKDIADLAFRDPYKRELAVYNVLAYSDQMRLRTAIEILKATDDIETQLEKVSCPLLVLHGAADKVTDPKVSEFLYNKACSKDKTLKLYDEGYHSILEGEPDDRILSVISDIISWLDSHSTLP